MIGFCILNYQNYDLSIKCSESIFKVNALDNNLFIVLIVDNGSSNDSYSKLKEYAISRNNLVVVRTSKNLGFANGNNFGYNYLKNNYKLDLICFLNSDTILDYSFSITTLNEIRQNNDFDILAPDIINSNGIHQNPLRETELTLKDIRKSLLKSRILLSLLRIPLLSKCVLKKYASDKKNKVERESMNLKSFNHTNFVPHGACIIVSNKWIEKEKFVFLTDTFLYAEEDFLYAYCKKKGYKILFSGLIIIYHMEDGTLNYLQKNVRKRLIFSLHNQIESLRKLLKYRKESR